MLILSFLLFVKTLGKDTCKFQASVIAQHVKIHTSSLYLCHCYFQSLHKILSTVPDDDPKTGLYKQASIRTGFIYYFQIQEFDMFAQNVFNSCMIYALYFCHCHFQSLHKIIPTVPDDEPWMALPQQTSHVYWLLYKAMYIFNSHIFSHFTRSYPVSTVPDEDPKTALHQQASHVSWLSYVYFQFAYFQSLHKILSTAPDDGPDD